MGGRFVETSAVASPPEGYGSIWKPAEGPERPGWRAREEQILALGKEKGDVLGLKEWNVVERWYP